MTSLEKLQLVLTGRGGKDLHKVTCLPGRITCLAGDAGAVEPYQAALRGAPRKGDIEADLDGQTFSPAEHAYLAPGVTFDPPEGSDSEAVERDLASLAELVSGSAERESARQISSALRSPCKVITLCDPLAPFSGDARDRMANWILAIVREKRHIVIVTGGSIRDFAGKNGVTSIEVGHHRKATLVLQRDGSVMSEVDNLLSDNLPRKRTPLMAGAALILLGAAILFTCR